MLLFAYNGRMRARKILVWQLGLLASEWGVWFAPVALGVGVWSACAGVYGLPGVMLSGAALALFLCPEVQSWRMGRKLDEKLQNAFARVGRAAPCPPSQRDEQKSGNVAAKGFATNPKGLPESSENPRSVRDGGQGSARPTFTYPASGGVSRRLVFYPANRPDGSPAPCVVVVHSGGWESGSPEEFPGFHRALAKSGYAVACPEYSLSPALPWPAPREDIRAAIAWIKVNAAELGIDPDNLVLFGRSAGGQIALCTAYDTPDPAIRGVGSFYAPTDMPFAWRGSYDGDILDSPRLLKNYLGGRPHETPEIHADASPVVHAENTALPTLLLHGQRDELVWFFQMRRLARVLSRAGAPHLALTLPWARHAFDYCTHGPGGRIALRATRGFLERVVR